MPDRTDGLPVQEAARRLGISVQAVRKRARRGTLAAYKQDEIWYIVVPDVDSAAQVPGRAAYTPPETPQDAPGTKFDEDIAQILREQLAFMQREIEQRDAEISEMRRMHAEQIHELHVMLQTAHRQLPAVAADASAAPGRNEDDPPAPPLNASHSPPEREPAASPARWRRIMRAIFGT